MIEMISARDIRSFSMRIQKAFSSSEKYSRNSKGEIVYD